MREVRVGVHHLYGRGGYGETEVERVSHAIVGRDGDSGENRDEHVEGRDESSDSRLGDERGDDALHFGLRGWSSSVPDDGQRFPLDDW